MSASAVSGTAASVATRDVNGKMLSLADRCEQATGPDENIDTLIALAMRRIHPLEPNKVRYTSALDAAMTLIEGNTPNEIVREAVNALNRRFNLHSTFWSADQSYSQWLARFVCAAALRSRTQPPPLSDEGD